MKRWAWLTMLLYASALTALAGPLFLWAFPELKPGELAREALSPRDGWAWGAVLGVLTLLQGLALLVPVRIAEGRPVQRAPWAALAAVAGLLMGLLLMTGIFSLAEGIWKEEADSDGVGWTGLAAGAGGWIFWTIVFARLRRGRDDRRALRGVVGTLVAGSLAELLVAVPSHILVRKKEYCCAGWLTFSGLAAGFSVLLFAYGPATYFLLADRLRRLRPEEELSPPGPPAPPPG